MLARGFSERIGADNRPFGKFLKGFGQDQNGAVYVLESSVLGPAGSAGQVLRIVACYANCDGSNTAPVLNVADFTCFPAEVGGGRPGGQLRPEHGGADP